MIMVPKCQGQILALFLAVWLQGTCLTSLGLSFITWEIASTVVLISQGCTDKTSYVCKVIEWCLVQGRTRMVEVFSVTTVMEEASRQGMLRVLSCSISTSVWDVIPTTRDMVLYTGKRTANKNASKATHLSNVLWCGGEVGEDVKSAEVRMAVPVPWANDNLITMSISVPWPVLL